MVPHLDQTDFVGTMSGPHKHPLVISVDLLAHRGVRYCYRKVKVNTRIHIFLGLLLGSSNFPGLRPICQLMVHAHLIYLRLSVPPHRLQSTCTVEVNDPRPDASFPTFPSPSLESSCIYSIDSLLSMSTISLSKENKYFRKLFMPQCEIHHCCQFFNRFIILA